jgi:hypothetical protein
VLLLYAMWRIEVLGWPVKRAAVAAGFPDRNAFANYVARQAACSIGELKRRGGLDLMLSEFVGFLHGIAPHAETACRREKPSSTTARWTPQVQVTMRERRGSGTDGVKAKL